MAVRDTKKVLALLLALSNLEESLNKDEKAKLEEIGQLLKEDTNEWKFVQKDLMYIVEANISLKHLYQEFITDLACVNNYSLLSWLQTNVKSGSRGRGSEPAEEPDRGADGAHNNTIYLLSIVCNSEEPNIAARNSTLIEKLKTSFFISKPEKQTLLLRIQHVLANLTNFFYR